jgi:polyferredoxin
MYTLGLFIFITGTMLSIVAGVWWGLLIVIAIMGVLALIDENIKMKRELDRVYRSREWRKWLS